MKTIPLNGKYANGQSALIDDQDYDNFMESSWSVGNTGYPRCTRDGIQVFMHDLIMPAIQGMMVDHEDQNKLNNQRDNLRYVTKSQNMQNRPKQVNNTSGSKGVYFLKSGNRTKRWFAKLKVDGKYYQSEYVDTKDEAAKLYDQLASKYQGIYKSSI
jgi:hypothetical protein